MPTCLSRWYSPAQLRRPDYFEQIDRFLRGTIGQEAGAPLPGHPRRPRKGRAHHARGPGTGKGIPAREWRCLVLQLAPAHVEHDFQHPFKPTHEAMAALDLGRDQPAHLLAANLRRAFSGIVAGNVKDDGIRRIEEHGSLRPARRSRDHGSQMDQLLESFVAQQRMRLPGFEYRPCYRLVA
jgi:pyrimidine/purine-5'-nucleotide nucleosidase